MNVESKGSEQEKPLPPEGVMPDTWYFLLDVVEAKAYESIDAERRNMIGIYFGSDASIRDLQTMFGYTSFSSVKYKILSGIDKLWRALPEEIREGYNPEVVGTMKLGMSEKTRKRMSEARKQRWDNDPEYRDTILGHNQARRDQYKLDHPPVPKEPKPPREKKPKKPTIPVGSPEDRARKSAIAKALWADPEYRARMIEAAKNKTPSETLSATLKAVWQDSDYRAEMSIIRKETWEDPIHRENMTVGIQRGARKPEARAKRSEISKNMWSNPEFKKNRRVAMKTKWSDMVFREHMLSLMFEGRTMPDRKAKVKAVGNSLEGVEVTVDSIRSEEFMGRIKKQSADLDCLRLMLMN